MSTIYETKTSSTTKINDAVDKIQVGYICLDRVNKYGSITMCLYLTEDATQYLTNVTEVILSAEDFDTYFENGGDMIENSERFMMENCEVFTGIPREISQ